MGFTDINDFHFGGYSPDHHAYRTAEKEANEKFASSIASLKEVWAATAQTQELWGLKGPLPRPAPHQEVTYYYTRGLDEVPEEGPRMEEARRKQAADFAAWEEYLKAKAAFEAEKGRLVEAALSTPEAKAYDAALQERETWLAFRYAELKAAYTAAWAAAGHPQDWLA